MQSASCVAECVHRSPHRVSTKERFSDNASRPDFLSFKPRQADSLRASASKTPRESNTKCTWDLSSCLLPTLKWNCFSDEFSQGKANVAEFSLSVSCCLQLCRIGTSCHSGQLATVPADHTDRTFRLFQECLVGHSNDVSSLRRSSRPHAQLASDQPITLISS